MNDTLNARVLATRLVRRRNFAGFPFLVSASLDACAAIEARAIDYAQSQGFAVGARLADRSPEEIGCDRERGLLPEHPVTFPGKRAFKRLFTKPLVNAAPFFGNEHALFGEVEHWTHVRVVAGLPTAEETARPREPQGTTQKNSFAPFAPFAHSAAYGFLTSNPFHAGTGLQIEAALHVPALAADRRPGQGLPAIEELQRALGAMGYDLSPLSSRTPGSAESGYFRLASRGGMDFPEETLLKNFTAKAERVLDLEAGALERWHKRDPNRLEDRVHRALRLLQEARRMEHPELLSLVSFARIGVYLGILPENLREPLETLRIESQPFLLRHSMGGPDSGALEPARAALARRLTAGIHPVAPLPSS